MLQGVLLSCYRSKEEWDAAGEPAFTVDINATAIGPNVKFSTQKLEWGKAPVLVPVPRVLTLFNDSLVPALSLASVSTMCSDSERHKVFGGSFNKKGSTRRLEGGVTRSSHTHGGQQSHHTKRSAESSHNTKRSSDRGSPSRGQMARGMRASRDRDEAQPAA